MAKPKEFIKMKFNADMYYNDFENPIYRAGQVAIVPFSMRDRWLKRGAEIVSDETPVTIPKGKMAEGHVVYKAPAAAPHVPKKKKDIMPEPKVEAKKPVIDIEKQEPVEQVEEKLEDKPMPEEKKSSPFGKRK